MKGPSTARGKWAFALFLWCCFALLGTASARADARSDDSIVRSLTEPLRGAVSERARAGDVLRSAVAKFYAERNHAVAWVGLREWGRTVDDLVRLFETAEEEGFEPSDYNIAAIRRLRDSVPPNDRAALDVVISEAVLRYAMDMQGWRINGATLPNDFRLPQRRIDPAALLALAAAADDPVAYLKALAPTTQSYRWLKALLADYRKHAAAGGWPTVTEGTTLEPGAHDARVPALRRRLALTDGAPAQPPRGRDTYDAGLAAAVRQFQARHGLVADGKIGKRTFQALNVSAEDRVRQIEVALDWHRAMVQPSETPQIYINLPEFRMRVVENEQEIMSMAVIVGRQTRTTPILSSRVTEIIYNPFWTVPSKIAREDKLPDLQKDPKKLVDQGFKVYQGQRPNHVEVDPMTVDWKSVTRQNWNYWLRQNPGPKNALGEIRFTFPNNFDVYMHGTPDRHLFGRDLRTLSSGCIRLERPLDLAEYILGPQWTREQIETAIKTGTTRSIPVSRQLPVHIVYVTAWVTPDGVANFREDMYKLDELFYTSTASRSAAILSGLDVRKLASR